MNAQPVRGPVPTVTTQMTASQPKAGRLPETFAQPRAEDGSRGDTSKAGGASAEETREWVDREIVRESISAAE